MERQLIITKIHPYHADQNTTLTLTDAGARELAEALAEVLGARIDFDWTEPELDAEVGTIAITTTKIATRASEIKFDGSEHMKPGKPQKAIITHRANYPTTAPEPDVFDPSRTEGSHFVVEPEPVTLADDAKRVGAEIIAACPRESDDATVVLAQFPGYQLFVTWQWSAGAGFIWGHYFSDEDRARTDFHKRTAD